MGGKLSTEKKPPIGLDHIPCIIFEDGEMHSEAAIISENLHRTHMTSDELQEARAEWAVRIMGRKEVSGGDRQKLPPKAHPHAGTGVGSGSGGGRPKGGIAAAAREMGVPRSTVQDAISKVTSNKADNPKPKTPSRNKPIDRHERQNARMIPTSLNFPQHLTQKKSGLRKLML
jgi:hypothetical protein